ncbi:TIGR01777 family oxidoreductase [Bacillaceae bacterium S4-13-58]
MNIAIAGGTGFVGRELINFYTNLGHQVYVLTRSPQKYTSSEQIKYVGWLYEGANPEKKLPLLDAIVNLAGESLNSGRWTEKRKQRILESRIQSTNSVISLMENLPDKPKVLINASAIGFYGTSESATFTEETTIPGDDFLAHVVNEWEKTARQASDLGVRVTLIRFGVILGDQGALPKMILPFQLFVGGKLGKGNQWISWIHIQDVVGIIHFAIENENISGPINATAPHPKRNHEFSKILSDILKRPYWIPAPSFALRLALGEMSELVLKGQYVLPKKAQKFGYVFQYDDLQTALSDIIE